MRAEHFVLQHQHNLGPIFSTSKMHLSYPLAQAGVYSKAAIMLLLMRC